MLLPAMGVPRDDRMNTWRRGCGSLEVGAENTQNAHGREVADPKSHSNAHMTHCARHLCTPTEQTQTGRYGHLRFTQDAHFFNLLPSLPPLD